MNTEIFIENRRLDISADISTLLNFAIDDIKDFASRSTTWSKTIVLPGTANNNKLFGHIFQIGQANDYTALLDNVNYNFNASKSADCIIFQDQMQTFKGVLRLMQINITKGQIEYEVAVFGEIAGLNVSLNGGLLEDLDFSEYDHAYNASGITGSWANTSGVDVYYPLIDYGTYSTLKDDWDIRTFRPALHVREYIDKMMTAAGFRWESDLFDTARFKTLIVPNNQKNLYRLTSEFVDAASGVPYSDTGSGNFLINDTADPGVDINSNTVKFNSITIASNFTDISGLGTTFQYNQSGSISIRIRWRFRGRYGGSSGITDDFYAGIRKNGAGPTYSTADFINYQSAPIGSPIPTSFDFIGDFTTTLVQNDSVSLFGEFVTGPPGQDCTVELLEAYLIIEGLQSTLVVASPGDTINLNTIIPKNVRQIDFLSGIIKLFNLYAYESLNESRLIRFTPYVDFYSQNVYPPDIAITDSVALSQTADFGTTVLLSSRTYTSGRLYLIAFQVSKDTPPDEPSIAGTNQTWTKIADISSRTIAAPTSRIAVFRFLATSTFTANTTITVPTGGPLHTGRSTVELELTGMVTTGTNGSDAIVQAVTNSADAGANPSITMAPISNSRNAVISFFTNNANPFGATAESGWTLLTNSGYNTPSTGMITMSRLATTDNTPTVTAAASDWAGIAIEIKSQDAETLDWTYKLNRDKTLKIRPMSELTAKKYEFKYKSDSDFYNEAYRKRYGQGYGDHVFDSEFEFAESNKSFEIVFSATPLVGYVGEDKIFPTIFKSSNDVEERIDSNIRIMQSKKITGVTSWDIKDGVTVLTSTTDYGYAGHFDDPDAPSNDLNFGALRELFFTLASGDLTTTQFNVYWSAYMAEITDKDSKLLSAWFYLTAKDIFNLDFSKKIWIDGVLFRLNAIKDYNISNISDCEVELLKINYLIY